MVEVIKTDNDPGLFNGSSNRGNELEKFVSWNNRQVDHENAQFNVEEAKEGLFSFDQSDEQQEVSIGRQEESIEEGYHSRGWQRVAGQEQ